ncbi:MULTISPECIES: Coagulation factor 5/8 type-like protein [unclassified Microcoleus]|uniref:Coagulation factor 5/8 type-like protein n=1 Tax=unclassified Microcoleus TaxID=2642155 RepID=UPI002FD5FD14
MALEHRFFCLREGEVSYAEYMKYFKIKFEVSIHDDVMRYMNDTLMWIPCTHLSVRHRRKAHGLMLYGDTIINQEGVEMFYHVIESWYRLFSKAPEKFQLDGGIIIEADRTVSSPPKVHTIEVERDLLLEKLRILLNYANQVIEGEFFILHLGI